jgi:hypothetical protein
MAATPQETEAKLANDYLETATLGRELATTAMRLALEQANAGTLRDPAKTAMNAIITSGTALDKRLILQNRPTQITEHRDPKLAAAALARRLGVSIDSTAEELEPPEVPDVAELPTPRTPLLPERAAANPQARARDRSVSSPAD